MAIYNKSGMEITAAYDLEGETLSDAYDLEGNSVLDTVDLTIMTYNVGQWYIGNGDRVPIDKKLAYYALQYGSFSDNQADVLCMQEYLNSWCQDNSLASELYGAFYNRQEVTNPQGYIGHSICTNGYEISNYTSHSFTENRGNYPTFESAEIIVDGKIITIINTHNDYDYQYQVYEIDQLLTYLESLSSFILVGDFNIDLSSQDTTNRQYLNSVKRFLDAGYNVGNCVKAWIPTYFGTSSPTGGKYTDQVVTSSNIKIVDLYADTTKLTDDIGDKIDHLPLIAKFHIT